MQINLPKSALQRHFLNNECEECQDYWSPKHQNLLQKHQTFVFYVTDVI